MATTIEPTVKEEPMAATDSEMETADSTVAVASESEIEREVDQEIESARLEPRLEQKYRHPMLDKVKSPPQQHQPKSKKTKEETIDDAVTRALSAYCHMRKHETDYYPAEIEQIYDVTVQLVISKIVLVHEKKGQDIGGELLSESAKKYPYIYYELSELREAQQRRLQFFDGYKDLVAIANINDFVDEMNEKFAEAIDEVTVQLEELIHHPWKTATQHKSKKKPTTKLTDVVADVRQRHKGKTHRRHH